MWRSLLIMMCCLSGLIPGLSGVLAQDGNAIVTGDTPVRGRLGPGYGFAGIEQIPPHSPLQVRAVSPDGAWVQVDYLTLQLWVEHDQLTLPDNLALPTAENLPPEPQPAFENCISLVGDSVANGEVVYMVPGHGFGVIRMTPLSVILQAELEQQGLGYLEVRDRTTSAAFLSDLGKNPYEQTDAYRNLLDDNCRVIIIMPWVNDLSVERPDPAQAYMDDMTALMATLHDVNPGSKILLPGFYYGQRAEFVAIYAPGYLDENIVVFNAMLAASCQSIWREMGNITCLMTENLFTSMEGSHVVLEGSREEIEAHLYEPIPPDIAPFFEVYWQDNPDAPVIGDGVHLSEAGKQRLAAALVQEILRIAPGI